MQRSRPDRTSLETQTADTVNISEHNPAVAVLPLDLAEVEDSRPERSERFSSWRVDGDQVEDRCHDVRSSSRR